MSAGRRLPIALGLAALACDPLAPSAVVKAGALLLVGLVAAASRLRGHRPDRIATAAAALAAWQGLSLTWSAMPEPLAAAPAVVVALVALAVSGTSPEERTALARRYAAVVGVGSGALALVEWLAGREASGGHGNSNGLGLVAAACLPTLLAAVAAGVRPADARRGRHIGRVLVLVATAFALVAGRSRTAWFGLAVGAVLLLRGRRRALAASALGVGVAALVVWRPELRHALAGRHWIGRTGLDVARASLPLGVGAGSFPRAFLEAQAGRLAELDPPLAASTFVHAVTPHGDWIGLLATGGLPALALAVVLAHQLSPRRGASPAGRATLAALGVAALGDDVFALPAVAALLPLLGSPSTEERATPPPRSSVLAWALVAGASWLLPAALRRHASQRTIHEAARVDGEPAEYRRLLERARRLDPRDGEAALLVGLDALAEGEPARALDALATAERRLGDVGCVLAQGNAELELGHPRAAIARFSEAARLDPGSFRAHTNLAEALRRAGELDRAERALAVARTIQPHHPKLERLTERLRRARIERETDGPESPAFE